MLLLTTLPSCQADKFIIWGLSLISFSDLSLNLYIVCRCLFAAAQRCGFSSSLQLTHACTMIFNNYFCKTIHCHIALFLLIETKISYISVLAGCQGHITLFSQLFSSYIEFGLFVNTFRVIPLYVKPSM